MSYKLMDLPSFGYVKKMSNSSTFTIDDPQDSGANYSSSEMDFQTKVSCIGRFIISNRDVNKANYVYSLEGLSSYSTSLPIRAGMIPLRQNQLGLQCSEETFSYRQIINPAIYYDGISGGEVSSAAAEWSSDSHVQYWRAT